MTYLREKRSGCSKGTAHEGTVVKGWCDARDATLRKASNAAEEQNAGWIWKTCKLEDHRGAV